ncbi:MAG: redoxin domain-containing protein, partial [Paraglaciecola chathamensis]
MSTLKQQTDAQIEKSRQAKPEFMQSMDELMAKAHEFEQGSDAIDVGQQAPKFTLPSAQGQQVSLTELCAKGPVVVTFYRGDWCPYCNLQLRAL